MSDTERKAAAFDWLVSKMQESYDRERWVSNPFVALSASTTHFARGGRSISTVLNFADKAGQPLNFLAAIEAAMEAE